MFLATHPGYFITVPEGLWALETPFLTKSFLSSSYARIATANVTDGSNNKHAYGRKK